ncbi:hypothetical protein Gohar_026008, partial [Gossypium harknessii]|nr:hypothetical protein [Gossypium harknessii]
MDTLECKEILMLRKDSAALQWKPHTQLL